MERRDVLDRLGAIGSEGREGVFFPSDGDADGVDPNVHRGLVEGQGVPDVDRPWRRALRVKDFSAVVAQWSGQQEERDRREHQTEGGRRRGGHAGQNTEEGNRVPGRDRDRAVMAGSEP